ncbi:RNA-binding protein [Bacillus phage G]|uniref:Gp540 n=1 Tax=Bacillus phage G TaxID=2884420 RepID=G3MAT0_9CAUD|nr:RNA-binding protein [Bacillus phage G]AEO93797.1 gp540 [Bacillus phage G]
MSKMSKKVKETRKAEVLKPVENFMGGISYEHNPLLTLKMVSASSIFGEPQYYRSGEFAEKNVRDGSYRINSVLSKYDMLLGKTFNDKNTSEIMEEVIDAALSYDFEGTLRWAVELRKDFYMRLNPQVIMVRAAMHEDRAEFNEKNPGLFAQIQKDVMSRADEPSSQLTYWLHNKGSKSGIPSILKRTWKNRLESMTRYEAAKYKNANVGMIDTARISHAKGDLVGELLTTGTIEVDDSQSTWNVLRSNGQSWKEILSTIQLPHMALLRNLRGIFEEVNNKDLCKEQMDQLKAGVVRGKQFPFRYYQAYKMVSISSVNHKQLIMDTLEECIDIALENMPKLKGKTVVLTDNSGSAHGAFTSEYGTVNVAQINNLSAVLTAKNAEDGEVYTFGDQLKEIPISKRNGALIQAKEVDRVGQTVGMGTEHGVWLYLDKIIRNKIHVDNLFIYSDMQAGHGRLYGTNASQYSKYIVNGHYIDVYKLIEEYRSKVNPKVNVFTVQTAGYSNVLIPEVMHRGSVLYGWTGKETVYAEQMIKLWEQAEMKKQ